jgi:predicted dehydrogenase
MVRIGIVGCNYGRAVHIPAFRLDPRCKIVAIAATERARAAGTAAACNVALHFGSCRELVEHDRRRKPSVV